MTAQYQDIYSTDLFTARAKKYLVDHAAHAAAEPFFMYLAYTAPHDPQQLPGGAYPDGAGLSGGLQWPLIPTPKTRDTWVDPQYVNGTFTSAAGVPATPWTDRMKRYATVIGRLDRGVGDVVQTLRDLKIDGNTLVIFTSDNGPSAEGIDPRRFDSWGPFDGFKRDLWEGGVREPTIVSWPGHVAAGQSSQFVSGFWDWMPTFADVAGLAPPAQADGVSLMPLLTGAAGQRSRGFVYEDYFFYSPPKLTGPLADVYARKHVTGRGVQQMLRMGDYVAVRTQIHHPDDPLRLYNVVLDPHEDHDFAADPQYEALLSQMHDEIQSIHRPDKHAPRPYDATPVPAITVPTTGPSAKTLVAGMITADVFAGEWPWVPNLDALTPAWRSQLKAVELSPLGIGDNAGVRFTGYLDAPGTGEYTFWMTDDAGAHLWLNDAHVIDDDFNHDGTTACGSILLKTGVHPFRLFYRHKHGDPSLRLEIAGPGIPRQLIPSNLLATSASPSIKP